MRTPIHFDTIVSDALLITQGTVWSEEIISGWHLVGLPKALGLFLVAHKPATPREIAGQLALRQVQYFAASLLMLGFQTQPERKQAGEVLQ